MNRIPKIIENLINGNITHAKEMAKNHSFWNILTVAEDMGMELKQRVATASFLKGKIPLSEYCEKTK